MAQFQWNFNTPADRAAKMTEWQQRDWPTWLASQLQFPFEATRTRDEDADAGLLTLHNPFPLGSHLTVVGLADPAMNDYDGIMVKVQRGSNQGQLALADLEVTPKNNPNYDPVQEFVVYWTSR